MSKKSKVTWAANIPLIGGMPLAAEQVLGRLPEFVAGYNGFGKHDGQYMNWLNVTNGHKVPYYNLDEGYPSVKADIIVSTPPCAGLSMMNCAKCSSKVGSDAAVNDWMYRSLEDNIDRLGAKVVITENAPALYTERGKGVREKLTKIAHDRGYSVTFYKTTTRLHGIPQERIRTFFFAWQSETAPVLEWYNKPCKNFNEYILDIPKDALHSKDLINKKLVADCGYHLYLKHRGIDVREATREAGVPSAFAYIYRSGLLDDAIEWFADKPEFLRRAKHAKMKFSKGLGIWDGSVQVPKDVFNAFVGRNAFQSIHPIEERSLSIREGMHLMGMPHNFELLGGGSKYANMICQNVPVCTAGDMIAQAEKFLLGKLQNSECKVMCQNNIKQVNDTKPASANFGDI